MNKKPRSIPIILASTSPRRIGFMKQMEFDFEVYAPETNEQPQNGEKPRKLVARLAREKAEAAIPFGLKKYTQCLIIAADTIVVAPNRVSILGKPKNPKDAERMLKMLAGQTHEVLTGYCLLIANRNGKNTTRVKVTRTRVKIRDVTPQVIKKYIQSGEPLDKAGSYGAQGLGMALIESIQGSYTNVVGLPMTQLLLDLEDLLKISFLSWTTHG